MRNVVRPPASLVRSKAGKGSVRRADDARRDDTFALKQWSFNRCISDLHVLTAQDVYTLPASMSS